MLDVMPLVTWAAGVLLSIVVAVLVIMHADARRKAVKQQQDAGEQLHGIALMPVSWAAVAVHIMSLICFAVAFAFYLGLSGRITSSIAGFYDAAAVPSVIIAFVLLFGQISLMLIQTLRKL